MSRARVAFSVGLLLGAGLLGGVVVSEVWHRTRSVPRPARLPLTAKPLAGAAPASAEPIAVRWCEVVQRLPGRRAAECCQSVPSDLGFDACVSTASAALRAGSIRIDVAALDDCASAMATALSGCAWVGSRQPPPPAVCSRVAQGLVGLGGSCASSLACAAPLHCNPTGKPGSELGHCSQALPSGERCTDLHDLLAGFTRSDRGLAERARCETGFCSPSSQRCEPAPIEGAPCRAAVQCASGQRCQAGACRDGDGARRGNRPGEACASDFDCEQGGCVAVGSEGQRVCGMSCPSPSVDLQGLRKHDQAGPVTLGFRARELK
jgi:hypothetical protein